MRIWIHGYAATKTSFNYIKTQMSVDDDIYIEYNSNCDLVDLIEKIRKKIEKIGNDEKIDLVGHSLGGVICVILYHLGLTNIRSIVTMSAPFGGITNNSLLRFWFPRSIFTEFHKLETKYSHFINLPIKIPHLFIVSNKGNNPIFLNKKNDGVVSVSSQVAIPKANYVEIPTNHYEILMNDKVVNIIKDFHSKLD